VTRRCLGIVTMLLGAATFVGACSAETAGVARGVPSSATSQTSTGNSNSPSSQPRLSPPIERPELDLTAAKENPCSLLSESFMKSYGSFRPGKVGDDRGIRQCEFDPTTSDSPLVTLQIFIIPVDSRGRINGVRGFRISSLDKFGATLPCRPQTPMVLGPAL